MHVIIVYVMYYKKSNFRLYVLLLATVDLIASLLLIPQNIIEIFYFRTPRYALSMFSVILPIMLMISLSLIVLIGVDRARRVIKPFGTQLTYAEAKFTCAMIFVADLIVIVILEFVPIIYMETNRVYSSSYDDKLLFKLAIVAGLEHECLLICLVVICFVVYTIMGVHMCRKLIKFGKLHAICKCTSNVELLSDTNHHLQVISEIDRIRASSYTKGARKVFIFLMMAFVSNLCITPRIVQPRVNLDRNLNYLPIQDFLDTLNYRMKLFRIIHILQCVQYLNHCINPIVYGLFDLQFRKRCVMLYKRCWSNTRN